METDFWNNFWMVIVGILSLTTSIVAIVLAYKANKQVEKQIVLSNKQLLFEKRVDVFNILRAMNVTCSISFKGEDELSMENLGFLLRRFTRNEYFEDIYKLAYVEVGNESLSDIDLRKKYLEVLKKIILLSDITLLIFEENPYLEMVSNFVMAYHDFLTEIYDYYSSNKSSRDLKKVQDGFQVLKNKYNIMDDSRALVILRDSIKLF
ncbi:hypothetical protein LKF67_0105 [Lactococcus lactis subsp. lactis]|uniref:hypothetical protein n=1 Tax=Lactococcus lactis TaxID=1358 RepID=UPI00071E39B9|nr:hypothetical protein [Lactococcus lactis]KST95928.1 hypothetical protein LKF67_0105 [Lactococcus lactis subsp. lactis]